MDKEMYLILAAAVAYAACALLLGIALSVLNHPELFPILLLGLLGVAIDFLLIGQYWQSLLCVVAFLFALVAYIHELDRVVYERYNRTYADGMPSWMRNTPNPDEAMEVLNKSGQWMLSPTDRKGSKGRHRRTPQLKSHAK